METITDTRTATMPALTGSEWQLDPAHTMVEFSARHLMITTVKGRFGKVSGTVTFDATVPRQPNVEVEIDAASLDTREERRDNHLRSADFLDVEKHPTLRFRGTRIEGDPVGEFELHGELTIRGVTRKVVLDVSHEGRGIDPWGVEHLGFIAKTRIDRKDFGLLWNVALEAGGVLVGDEIKISIDAQLIRKVVA
jgi:polyisoprenoid-binding protein YceI